ncbi:alpha/beta fold hydrolase [Mucilaginibacter sp. X5P1]|uniref:alpha/beta fold hydrolase n=1 Tax=Mucilaginibacter sp. X5P1 TaxID=2723088 RepID=UPI0016139EC4|nr:alpha/beta hydrolase [Mucilaginibacter sp. X5P1]MBB6140142.1 pimeloyl-ACP methyl ester carboxylesterase [Mucilaginibacter sp. X5P1]
MENSKAGYAPVNGLNMYYEIHGNGDIPLVLVHGGGSTIETTFGNLLPIFSTYNKVIAVELQAHGRTSDRDAPESFMQDADDIAGLLNYLKVDKANFLGFSNGGSTAMQIAIRHQHIVNKIVVISGAYKRDGFIPGLFEGLQNATINDMPEFLKTAYLKVASQDNLQVMFNKDRERMLTFKDWNDDDLRSIKAAALIMVADHDVITAEHTVKMARLIPGARLAILPATHSSIIGESGAIEKDNKLYELTAAFVKEFLTG